MAVFDKTQLGLMAIVAIFTLAATHSWLSKKNKPLEAEPSAKLTKDRLSSSNRSADPESSAKPAKNYLTCRIRGVPLDWDKESLGKYVGATAVVKSLATEIDGRSRTATATFPRDYPRQIPITSSSGEYLTIDQDFLGITTLYAPDNPRIDVIAVSGLGGHAFGSFKERNGDYMWLRDGLPNDLLDPQTKRPMARIMIYGHDSQLAESHNMQELEDISTSFRDSILQLAAAPRPIVLIGHSLGGLIIKQALVSLLASTPKCQEEYERLARAVYGIVFLGVPHDGMEIDALRRVVGDKLSRSLIESLSSKNSSVLTNLRRDFNKLMDVRTDAEIFCFYETKESQTVQEDESGKLNMDGPRTVLVTKSSATHCRATERDSQHLCAIARSHSEIVKFGRHDHEYDKVRNRLRLLAQRAVDAKSLQLNDFTVPIDALSKECLKSLAFPEMDNRSNDIDTEADGTCRWLLDHHAYRKWMSSDRGLLWIKGKPGSGKSTLLRYALKNVEKTPDFGNGAVLISFFFHGRGTELQRTPLGLFRSVLHQVLSKVPNALLDLVATFKIRQETRSEWQWHYKELQDFLKTSLSNVLENRPMWLFIDALDESGDHALGLIQSFQSLLNSTSRDGFQFRICFTCRHYPILGGDCEFEICAEKENAQDISTYVQAQLSTYTISKIPDSIPRAITECASGVFMWARLVMERVRHRDCDGWGWKKIEEDIKTIPQDLDKLYQGLIDSMRERSASLKLIELICFATRPLSLAELRWAMFVDPTCPHKSLQQYQQCRRCGHCPEAEDYDISKMERRVKSLTCGLAETVPAARHRVVQFIHQSVKDFFIEKGLRVLHKDLKMAHTGPANCIVTIAHHRLYRLCILYLEMEEIYQSTSHNSQDLESTFPLLHYTTTSWVLHLGKSQASRACRGGLEVGPEDYLTWPSGTLLQLWIQIYGVIGRFSSGCPLKGTTPAHMASRYQLIGWLKEILQNADLADTTLDARDADGRTALSWAAGEGHEAVVKLLIDTGIVNVDSKDNGKRTPLLRAAANGHEAVVRLFLDIGREITVTEEVIESAARSGRNSKDVMTLLLDQRGDEIAITEKVIKAAAGNKEVMALLLDRRGDEIAITEEVIKAAAGNWRNGKEVMALLLDRRGDEIAITEGVIKAAAGNDWNGKEVMALLLDRRGYEIAITEEVIQAAARNRDNGKGIMALLLDRQGDKIAITEEVVKTVAGNSWNGKEFLALFLDRRGDEIAITEEVVKAAAGSWTNGEEVMALLLDRRGDEIAITEEVVKAAAGNWMNGKEVMALLLDRRGDEIAITEEVVKAAARNRDNGKEIMALLLDRQGDKIAITEEVVKAAAGNSGNGQKLMALLLDRRGGVITITEEVVKAAAGNRKNGKEVMALLLNRHGDKIAISEGVVKAAAGNEDNGKEVMALLLDRRRDKIAIAEDVVCAIAKNFDKEVMALLLNQRGDMVAITEVVVKAAAGNEGNGKEVMALLLDRRGHKIAITEEVVKAVAGNSWNGKEVMALLLDRQGDDMVITEEVVKAAARNRDDGKEIMALLLNRQGDKIAITEEVVKAAAGNSGNGQKLMALLLDRRGGVITITEEVVKAAAGNRWNGREVMALLLDRQGDKITITEEVVKAAAGNSGNGQKIIALLLDWREGEVTITEEVVKAAAGNRRNSKEMMALLLDRRGDEVAITEEVMKAAAGNSGNVQKLMALLLDRRGGVITITEEVVKAAAGNRWNGRKVMALLLDWRGDEIAITEEVLKVAVGNEGNGKEVMALLLDRRGEEVVITEEVVKAAATCGQDNVLDLLSGHDLIPVGEEWRRIAKFYNAARTGDVCCMKQLLNDGIEPDTENVRMVTPLWIAATNGHEAVVKLLAQRSDVRVNSKSISGRSPLFWPSSSGYKGVVIALMEAGADANIMDENGDTPVTVARRNGHQRIVETLEGGII